MAWVDDYDVVYEKSTAHRLMPPTIAKTKNGKGYCGLIK